MIGRTRVDWRRYGLLCAACLLLTSLYACTQPGATKDDLEALLVRISDDIGKLHHSGKSGTHRYTFASDPDFPCSATLTEFNAFDGEHWTRVYRFDLTDMTGGQLIVAKDGRRAISYYGRKTVNGETRAFTPKKINAFRVLGIQDDRLRQLVADAIAICEERNAFPEQD